MRRLIKKVLTVSFCLLSGTCLAGGFSHSDGTFENADWEQQVRAYGVDGSAGGTSSHKDAGGNPGAYREVFASRFPGSADPSNVAHTYQFARQSEFDPAAMGAVGEVDIALDARLFEGIDGMVAPALKQNGLFYVAAGQSVSGTAWAAKQFFGLTQNSFSEPEAPNSHPDFSANGATILFGFVYIVTAPTADGVNSRAGIDNWLLGISLGAVAEFLINAGLNDAWYFQTTAGQGFFITVFPEHGVIFIAWFTYDTERPDAGVAANLGEPGHRWVTAIGEYAGDTAVLDVELTFGGVFDSANPAPMQEANYGTITIVFHDCNSATLSYDFPSLGLMGDIPLTRIVTDNVPLCEALLAELVG